MPGECEVLEPDGVTDLFMKFRTQRLVTELELGELPKGAMVELILYGELLDGTPFEAMDYVKLTNRPR